MTWFLRRFGRVAIPAAALALQPWPAAAHFHETQAPVAPIMLLFALVVLAAAAYLWMLRKAAIFRDAMASVSRPRQVVDPEGKTFYATPAFRELLGDDTRPTPDCLAEQAADEEARQQVELLARNAKSGISGYAEIRVRPRGEGSAVEWRYVAAYPIEKWPGYVYWLVDDVRPKRQMDELILGEQRRFLDLLQDTPLGFYSLDGEGRFLFVNQRLADWLGRSREALQSGKLKLHHILAPPPPPGTAPSDALGGGEDQGDIVLKAADGGTFRAAVAQETERDETGEVQHSRAVVRHLTEESSLSGALAQAQRRFDHFFGHAPVGVALVDAEGQVIECNKVVRGLTGRDDGVPAGTDLLELIHEESRAAVEELLARAAEADGATGASAPVEARLAGEGETVCALFLNRVEAEEGGAFEYIVHFIDTTEQRSLEAQFVQSQKMQAVGQLAGGIAHDFNNLLTAMIGFSDLLLLRHRPGDQSFADIMQIKQNANRAANLVRQLLAFSRQQTLQPKIVNITDILAELAHLLQRLIGENIELKMVHGRDLGTIKADQGQLEQVIINLAVNARDAMFEGGTLTIQTDNVHLERDTKRKGETMPAGDYTRVQVIDSGSGISRTNQDRIFDPFFTTKEVGAGTGLGLSTVYGIVKQTGGFVFVDSNLGEGATFSILLPHHAETQSEEAEREAAAELSRDLTGVGTLLLVEDEDAVRAFSARALRNKGYNVLEARSGEAALELLSEQQDPIDLLITDVVMPKIDGPTLVKEVRGERPDLKVIFISGYAEDAFRKRLDQDAGIHFLPKPFSLKQLAGKVKEVMAENAA
jgi:two-component system cell cycle sensor histidine kinase/response regulator CckA